MKKALVVASYAPSLTGFRLPLIRALVNQGFCVHVAAPELHRSPKVSQELERIGVVVHGYTLSRNGLNPLLDFVSFTNLVFLMLVIKPNVFIGYTAKPVIYGSLAATLVGVQSRFALITGLGLSFQEDDSKVKLFERVIGTLYRLALTNVHKVFFQNPDDSELFYRRKILRDPARSLVVNGSGVDIDEFCAVPLANSAPRFLFVGRLLKSKGIQLYVEAARRIRLDHPHARFAIAGWIDSSTDSITAEELRLWQKEGCVDYLGRLDDVRPALAACTVFVLPSYYREGTPRSILEALAVGRAVITTDMPGCRETVVSGINGFLVEARSIDSLVNGMKHFLDCSSLAAQMGRESRQIAVSKYDVRLVCTSMLSEMLIFD